jgi:hypothetical protein
MNELLSSPSNVAVSVLAATDILPAGFCSRKESANV